MAYDHNLPSVLNPSGDYCVSLLIPMHPDYTALLLGVLRTLEDVERYKRDPNFDNEDALIVVAQWRDRTLTPLIDAIANAVSCAEGMMDFQYLQLTHINRTINSTTFVASSYSVAYTPTKPNARIRTVLPILQSSGAATSTLEIRYDGNVGAPNIPIVNNSNGLIQGEAIGVFNNLVVGVAKNIVIWGKSTTGTVTIQEASFNGFIEVIEWE